MTPKVFFTYVWGPPGNPASPLTFASKAARSHVGGRSTKETWYSPSAREAT
jgi:hypothetical protein